jgi:hypothetical protein
MNSLKATAQIVLAVSMVAALGLVLHAAEMSLFVIPFLLWVASPFASMIWAIRARRLASVPGWIFLSGAALLAISSVFAYRPVEIASRSTAALNFVFFPLWQNIAATLLLGVGWVLGRGDRRTSR